MPLSNHFGQVQEHASLTFKVLIFKDFQTCLRITKKYDGKEFSIVPGTSSVLTRFLGAVGVVMMMVMWMVVMRSLLLLGLKQSAEI